MENESYTSYLTAVVGNMFDNREGQMLRRWYFANSRYSLAIVGIRRLSRT